MPLIHTRQIDTHTYLGIWAITEHTEELLRALPSHIRSETVTGLAHPKRWHQWLASRILAYELLQHFTPEPLPLLHNEHGKPFFEGENIHLSITHSAEMAAVILSGKYEVGIDIEHISPKALRIADRFLSEEERWYTSDDIQKTCLYWSAKETLYKIYSKRKLILKENLSVTPAGASQNNALLGHIRTDNFYKLYQIFFETLHNHVLTYCIDTVVPQENG